VAGVRALTSAFRAGNFEPLDGKDTAAVITGSATLIDATTVAVGKGEDRITVTAPTILINTGTEPVIADIPGLANSSHAVSSTGLNQKDKLPERLAIVGGGYLGLEFAAIYQRFGTQVTEVVDVRDNETTSTLVYEKDGQTLTVDAEAVLAATGRMPAISKLNLEAAGVSTTARGAIEVDEDLRTSQSHIFASSPSAT